MTEDKDLEAAVEDAFANTKVGAITGYRVFQVLGDSLRSYSAQYVWVPGVNEATCEVAVTKAVLMNMPDGLGVHVVQRIDHDRIPDVNCGCGFWIYKDIETLMKKKQTLGLGSGPRKAAGLSSNQYGNFGSSSTPIVVVGRVKAWGKTIVGEDGWRTEFAKPEALLVPDKTIKPLFEPVAERYDLKVIFKRAVRDAITRGKKVQEMRSPVGGSRPWVIKFVDDDNEYVTWNEVHLDVLENAQIRDDPVEITCVKQAVYQNYRLTSVRLVVY